VQDFATVARQSTRKQFVSSFPHPFLVGAVPVAPSRRANSTSGLLDLEEEETSLLKTGESSGGGGRLTVLAVNKVTALSPGMITLGRTSKNDLVLDHPQISTFHAFFRDDGGFTLADAGSRNGTWVAGELLVPKGPPSAILTSGDAIRFAQFEFTFMTSGSCWDVLRVGAPRR
jgi:hypothetical protein